MKPKKRPGRPRLPDGVARRNIMTFRLSDGELHEAERIQRREADSMAGWVHDLIVQAVRRGYGLEKPIGRVA